MIQSYKFVLQQIILADFIKQQLRETVAKLNMRCKQYSNEVSAKLKQL